MRGVVLLFSIVVLGTFFILYPVILRDASQNNDKNFQFSTFTSAVCENKSELVYCRDEVFVNCSGNISRAIDVVECNGVKVDIPEIVGFAVFDENWKDPR